ncbi:MAG TPA: hydrogenase maturation protease [Bacteroidota bacterium]|nr:hydrogenase maturation protease [Bacteroidota bacterium]
MNGVSASAPSLLIGVGNEFRNDDALGILVAREIRRRHIPGVAVVERSGEGTALMDTWGGAALIIIVDAIFPAKSPGEIHRLDAVQEEIPRGFFHYSSHTFGVAEAVAMARQLGSLPQKLILYGIEGKEFGEGVGLSDPVLRSIPALIAMIEEDLHALHAV